MKKSLPIGDLRVRLLQQFIEQNKGDLSDLLAKTDRARVVLNIKGASIIPEVTVYPEIVK